MEFSSERRMTASVDQLEATYSVVAFRLDQKTYAVSLESVAQIIPMVKLTPLPQAQRSVAGVMNFRGKAVPVIDLRRYFHLPIKAYELHTPILLAYMSAPDGTSSSGERLVGLVVDEVQDVVDVAHQQVVRLNDILPHGFGELPVLQGLIHTSHGAIMLLDLAHIFSAGPLQTLPSDWEQVDGLELSESSGDLSQAPVLNQVES
jgi:chemotaxis signal transduction protein